MGMTGQEIYDNFHQHAAGTGSWQAAQHAASQIAQDLPGQAASIKRLQDGMEAAWTGDAADAAQQGVTPLALEHLNVADDLHAAQDLMSRQAASFHQAANAVLPMPPEPTVQDPLAAIAAGQPPDTMLTQVTQYHLAAQHNVDVMTTYHGASSYNATNMPAAYGTLADTPVVIAVQPAPSTAASPAPSKSAPSRAPRHAPTAGPTTPTGGEPATPGVGRPPAPSDSGGAVAPGGAGGSTTTSAQDGMTGPGSTGAAVGTGQAAAVAGGGAGGGSGLVAGQPRPAGPDGNLADRPVGGRPVDGPRVRGGPGEPGGGGQSRPGAGHTGGGAEGEPVGGSPAPRGLSGARDVPGAAAEEAVPAGPAERTAGAPGLPGTPASGGRQGEGDDEHHRKYPVVTDADAMFADGLPKVAPEAFGESPQQREARHKREAEGGH